VKGPIRRYADGPWAEVSVKVDATPEELWALISDIELPARFSNEFVGAQWVDGDGPRLGAAFEGRNVREGREWTTVSTVDVFEPDRSFGWVVGDPAQPTARWRFDIEPGADDVTLRMWAQMGPGPSGVLSYIQRHPDLEEWVVERRLEEWLLNMRATVNGIERLAGSS
jgi:hypothetical protein